MREINKLKLGLPRYPLFSRWLEITSRAYNSLP